MKVNIVPEMERRRATLKAEFYDLMSRYEVTHPKGWSRNGKRGG
jgi:hypothetical protein